MGKSEGSDRPDSTDTIMGKELITIEMERDSLQQKWGFTVQGGKDESLTAKIASVKRFSPADRAGLEKMDYVWTVNGKEVFNMTQPQITNEIVNSKLKMVLQVERGTFIVPSFDEIWPQPGKERLGKGSRRMGIDYILEVILRTVSIIIIINIIRQCNIMDLVTFPNLTTSPLVDALALKLTSTTTQSSATQMKPSRT